MRSFAKRYWLAITLGSLHLVLTATVFAIELIDAWNDMNATFLARMLFIFIDYPLVRFFQRLDPDVSNPMAIIILGVLGTALWSLIGLALQAAWRNRARRFSLQTLLIATTLIAIALAIIAALAR